MTADRPLSPWKRRPPQASGDDAAPRRQRDEELRLYGLNASGRSGSLMTRAELMKRNSYHNRYPKEVARLVQLRGAVTRQINKRSNQA